MEIKYTEEGIVINDKLITLSEIKENVMFSKIKNNKLILLKLEIGRRSVDIYHNIIIKSENIEDILSLITDKKLYFVEIEGKHSKVYMSLDKRYISIVTDEQKVMEFIVSNDFENYNFSFIDALNSAGEG